jgi:hypothetical protein
MQLGQTKLKLLGKHLKKIVVFNELHRTNITS